MGGLLGWRVVAIWLPIRGRQKTPQYRERPEAIDKQWVPAFSRKCPDDYRDGLPGGSLGPSSMTGSRQLSLARRNPRRGSCEPVADS